MYPALQHAVDHIAPSAARPAAGVRRPIGRGGLASVMAALLWAVPALAQAPAAATADPLAEDVRAGFSIMHDVAAGNCVSCHVLPGQGGLLSSFGPSLAGIGARMNADELRQWIVDARRLKPDTLMPPFGTLQGLQRPQPARPILDERQIRQVLAALQTLR